MLGKVTTEDKFPCAVCRKHKASNSILCQCCRCWVHGKCSSVRGKLKEDGNLEYQACANQQTDISEDCPSVELSSVSL